MPHIRYIQYLEPGKPYRVVVTKACFDQKMVFLGLVRPMLDMLMANFQDDGGRIYRISNDMLEDGKAWIKEIVPLPQIQVAAAEESSVVEPDACIPIDPLPPCQKCNSAYNSQQHSGQS